MARRDHEIRAHLERAQDELGAVLELIEGPEAAAGDAVRAGTVKRMREDLEGLLEDLVHGRWAGRSVTEDYPPPAGE